MDKDPRYEQFSYRRAESRKTFRDATPLWDQALFLFGDIKPSKTLDAYGQPSCYFITFDGYGNQRASIMCLPSAIWPTGTTVFAGQRVIGRVALSIIGGKLQIDTILTYYPEVDDQGFCTITPNYNRPIPTMQQCIEDGHYIHAGSNANRTRIGVLQLPSGTDHSIEAIRKLNEFLITTRPGQMSMFRSLLPPMRMGGPEHVPRHPSCIFYDLSKPDDDAMAAQDERDFRHKTMTPQQIQDLQTRIDRSKPPTSPAHAASAQPDQTDLTGEPDASPNIFMSPSSKSPPTGTPPPIKATPAPEQHAQLATVVDDDDPHWGEWGGRHATSAASSSNCFSLTAPRGPCPAPQMSTSL